MGRNFRPSKVTVVDRNFRPSKITIVNRNVGPSKITIVDRYFGPSKITVHIDQMDGPNLLLTGGPSDHRPNGQSKITSHRWSIGSSSILTFKFSKFGRSKLSHLDPVAFLVIIIHEHNRQIGVSNLIYF